MPGGAKELFLSFFLRGSPGCVGMQVCCMGQVLGCWVRACVAALSQLERFSCGRRFLAGGGLWRGPHLPMQALAPCQISSPR